MSFLDNIKDDFVFLQGALRALRMTTPIAKNPARVFPVVIDDHRSSVSDICFSGRSGFRKLMGLALMIWPPDNLSEPSQVVCRARPRYSAPLHSIRSLCPKGDAA